ncbi:WGR domain-containing protein [Pararhizobium sp. YC-54]|uniref:WGR domain-containing protein n=1 Tax=Pararhizobium sp. YC-54 TaxID=2986920 RepID=UPI00299D8AE8|nr:WGR domain-containing protein [Pararhizobium sp. YC-54]
MVFGICGRIVTGIGEDQNWASFADANGAVRRRRTAQTSVPQHFTNLNRSGTTDSYLSLDGGRKISDSARMIAQPYHLYIERTEPEQNMARFYAISIEPTLFGDACLTRRWGRIGSRGQSKVHHFAQEKEAVQLFLDLVRQKRRRGYSTRPVGIGASPDVHR